MAKECKTDLGMLVKEWDTDWVGTTFNTESLKQMYIDGWMR